MLIDMPQTSLIYSQSLIATLFPDDFIKFLIKTKQHMSGRVIASPSLDTPAGVWHSGILRSFRGMAVPTGDWSGPHSIGGGQC